MDNTTLAAALAMMGKKSNNPEFTGSMSAGENVKADGLNSQAMGNATIANGQCSHAEGINTIAYGGVSHAEGSNTVAVGSFCHASGRNNIPDDMSHAPAWKANTPYPKNWPVKNDGHYYVCKNGSEGKAEFDATEWTECGVETAMAEIVGNGYGSVRQNARTLDWSGNEEIAGTFKCQTSFTIGSTTLTEAQLQALIALVS